MGDEQAGRGLDGRVALVTGGDSGIGAACATALAAAGADVAVMYHSAEDKAEKVAEAVRGHGRRALVIQGDVGAEADVEAAFDRTAGALGTVTVLVNSAGLNMSETPVAEMTLDQWQRVIRTDLTGSFLSSRRFVRDLRSAGQRGGIVNVTSIHAEAMRAGGADYGAAKGGQRNLTRTLALEVAEAGITVNAVAPGMILTPMNERAMSDDEYRRSLEANIPAKRAGRPEEIGDAVVFLVSDAARYITGTTLTVDGGLSLVLGQGA